MNSDIYVDADNIGYAFFSTTRPVYAVKAASCAVKAGDRIAIMGPSGSGKSTLLHLMAALIQPVSGNIRWPTLGERERLRPAKIGFLPQQESLVESLNVMENIELPLLFTGSDGASASRAAAELMERIGLSEIGEKLPSELSGGQMKRVAFARALVAKPPLILADEPTGQLDHATAQHFLSVIFDYIDTSRTALVITTHDKEVADQCETVWTMDHGTLSTGAK